MSDYTLALFAHIVGVIGLFIGIALDMATIARLRRAQTVAQVREATGFVTFQARLIQLSALLLLVAGMYMAATVWEGPPWILVSFGALIVMGALSGGLNGRRLSAIKKTAADEPSAASLSPAFQRRLTDAVLLTSAWTAGMLGLGVVFVMTTKPDLLISLLVLLVSVVLGVLFAQLGRRPRPAGALALDAEPGAVGRADSSV
jgi:uncharacterized membrane protein